MKPSDGIMEIDDRVMQADQLAGVSAGYVEHVTRRTGLPYSGRRVIKTSSTVREIVANENHFVALLRVSISSCGQSPNFRARYCM
jgi:hypothetical protein